VEAFLGGQYGGSEAYRVNALEETWRRVGEAPWGLGWGGFATQVDPERGLGRQYPHNLLAETTLESGWICGAATLLMLATAAVSAWSGTGRTGGRQVFVGVLFCAFNALVSGDLNDNRPLFCFISAALLVPYLGRPAGPGAPVAAAHSAGGSR
jgi:O-antigen ligase